MRLTLTALVTFATLAAAASTGRRCKVPPPSDPATTSSAAATPNSALTSASAISSQSAAVAAASSHSASPSSPSSSTSTSNSNSGSPPSSGSSPAPNNAVVLSPNNLVQAQTSSSGSAPLSALKYTHVGGEGSYDQVTNIIPGTFPTCDANPFCITQPKQISGNLAPFDDEMTIAFRGPMNIYNIAVYQPSSANASTWNKVSSWSANNEPSNLVFMNNDGGSKSGEWSICAGASQSYANGDWTDATTGPNAEIAKGSLSENHEINIMTATSCTSSPCAGFSRGTANHGWSGSKFFVFTFDMPPSSTASAVPAIWALNAQIVRAAQYGCNCRGVGPGGCGELDILETIAGTDTSHGISEIYSPKGATGSGAGFFARPTSGQATYGVLFDVETDQVAVQHYTGWDYSQGALSRGAVEGYLNAPAMTVSFASAGQRREDGSEVPRSAFSAHRRRHHLWN